jgi:glyoxylase-like metal-dependent hydrolase (beta-lactamase superfamily II)
MFDDDQFPPTVAPFHLTFLSTGYCTALERLAIRDGGWRHIRFHATCALIRHPSLGAILFDTGYAPRFFDAATRYPYQLYAQVTPVITRPEWSVAAQLPRLGLQASDINYIILSHFHADHVAGLLDFPQARIICSRAGLTYALAQQGLAAVRKGLLPALFPSDLAQRVDYIEALPREPRTDALGHHYRLLPDASICLIDLPGHARGQIGAWLQAPGQPAHLLAADAFWLSRTLNTGILPARLTGLIIDSWSDYEATIRRLRAFHQVHPDVEITSCHCLSTFTDKVIHQDLFVGA